MKIYNGKSVEDLLEQAANELNISKEDLMYEVKEESKGLFSKKATIEVYEISDVIEFAQNYVKEGIEALGFECEVTPTFVDGIINLKIESPRNSIIIGKNGRSLQSLNELTRLAVSNRYKKRFRILLDVSDYKEEKYARLIAIARKLAHEVTRTKVDAVLDPMPADERRAIHNALTGMPHIKTESEGFGKNRQIHIKYIG